VKVEKKIEEAKKRFIKGTKFVSIDYPDRGLSNEQINDEVIFKNYQPSLLWVKAKASFGEIMWMPIYDSNLKYQSKTMETNNLKQRTFSDEVIIPKKNKKK
jgi:hypothetical protein